VFLKAGVTWHLVPGGFRWAQDGRGLYVQAENCGLGSLYKLFLESAKIIPLIEEGTVSGYYSLGTAGERLLVTSTSFVDNCIYSTVDVAKPENSRKIFTASKHGLKFGLRPSRISEMYFEGDGDNCVQAWVIRPSDFDEKNKYPLAILIHGGPQSAWQDAWSTRWNGPCWAEQGYVVIMPNITGSTGFGLKFMEDINGSWGGRPYKDIVKCFEYVKTNMPFVDTTNAILAGASYGGYMANWIQGNSLGRKFKTIVCHDGIYNTQMLIAGDFFQDKVSFGGPMIPWKNWKNLERYNPARPDLLKNWKTPMLVIHSNLDYRCIYADGMAAFGALKAHGTPGRFLTFPDEGHWVMKPENSLVWHKTVFDWINNYCGVAGQAG